MNEFPINLKKYKLNHVDKNRVITGARKALITANNLYYSWDTEQQEKYRVSMNDQIIEKIQHVLLDSMLRIKCTLKVDIWDNLPLADLNILNWAILLTSGIGDDFIFLNESMAENTSLLDFSTVYDYNYDDYLFQEKARKEEFPEYEGMDYYALKTLISGLD